MATNKTLLGASFDDFVANQLKIRTKILSSHNQTDDIIKGNITRDNKAIGYAMANTSFIRLTSAVDINEEKAMQFGKKEYQGNGLAKSFILQGGTLNNGALRGGISGPNSAYTVGGIKDFGLRPMPGIVSATVASKSAQGALREATINIKCFNIEQLSIVETLYLRPGFTLLLEWGHGLFYNNKNETVNNIIFIDFFSNNTFDGLYKEVLNKREKYSGNYDGFVGRITNFNIKQNGDGTYNCMCKVISYGDIIESLKTNITGDISNEVETDAKIQPLVQEGLFLAKQKINKSKFESVLESFVSTCKNFTDGKKISLEDAYQKVYDTNSTGYSTNKEPKPIDPKQLTLFSIVPFIVSNINKTTGEANTSKALNTYIPLGGLLSVISKNCIVKATYTNPSTFNGRSPLVDQTVKSFPVININFNPLENFCYSPEYHISINPDICLIKYDGTSLPALGLNKDTNNINQYLPDFKVPESDGKVGYTMNIMVNINYILKTFNDSKLSNNEVILYDFLSNLMGGINIALGKINQFNVGIDDENNTITIRDNQILENAPKEITIINTMGLKSSVREITINSQLSNEFSSMVAIGAAAAGRSVEGIDTSVMTEYNLGLNDRFRFIGNDQPIEDYLKMLDNNESAKTIKKLIDQLYNDSRHILIRDDIETSKQAYSDILDTIKVKKRNSTGIIPFFFNIKMDGISGIRYGQLFSIEPSRLPKNYLDPKNKNQPIVAFLVTNVEHSIENNMWLTNITGQAAPIRDLIIKN